MLKRFITIGTILMAVAMTLPSNGYAVLPGSQDGIIGRELHLWLQSASRQIQADNGDTHHKVPRIISRFYDQRQFQPAWIYLGSLSDQGTMVLEILRNARDEALPDLGTHLDYIDQALNDGEQMVQTGVSFPLGTLVQLEVRLTQVVLEHISLIAKIRLVQKWNPTGLGRRMNPDAPEVVLAHRLAGALEPAELESIHQAVGPQLKQYQALKKILIEYESIQQLGGWPHIPPGPQLKMGVRDPRVPLLRWRLIVTADMPLEQLSPYTGFDQSLDQAVRRFQRRLGLKTDGIVGPVTLSALNTPVR